MQLADIHFGDEAVESRELTLPEIHEEVLAALRAGGYDTVDKLLAANPDDLAHLPGFDAETVEAVMAAARAQQAADEASAAAAAVEAESEPASADADGDPEVEAAPSEDK